MKKQDNADEVIAQFTEKDLHEETKEQPIFHPEVKKETVRKVY